MTVGHRPLPEGQAEQWQRIARIRLHQVQQQQEALNKPPEQANQQATETKFAEDSDDPTVRHAAAKARQVFENIISSEELPRHPKSIGSLSEHLSNTGKDSKLARLEGNKAKPAKAKSNIVDSLEQIAAAHLSMAQNHRRD